MDQDVLSAIERHEDRFGEFNVTTIGLDLSQAEVKRRLLGAIDTAISSGKPISDKDIGIHLSDDIMI